MARVSLFIVEIYCLNLIFTCHHICWNSHILLVSDKPHKHLIQTNQSSINSVEVGGSSNGVNEDKVLGQLLDILFELGKLSLAGLLLLLLANCVNLLNVSNFLVLLVDNFPLFLECSNKFFAFIISHEEFLLVAFILFFDLHFAYHLIFILDFSLDLLDVLGDFTEVFLLKVVLVSVGREFWSGKDVFNCICNDVVLVTNETHDRLLVFLGDRCTLDIIHILELSESACLWEHWVASSLLSETGGFWLHCSLGFTDGQ